MGNAPRSKSHPAMPDPARVVTTSAAVIQRTGIPRAQSFLVVGMLAAEVTRLLAEAGHTDFDWIGEIGRIAYERCTSPAPSVNDSQGGTSGDGPGRTASGAAEQEDRTPQG